jgi:hypothetical protein
MGRRQDIDIGIVGIGQDLGGDVDMPKVIVSMSHVVSVGRDVSWPGYRSPLTSEEGQKATAHQTELAYCAFFANSLGSGISWTITNR